ncbi:MAG: hypothetical protein JW384_03212 [Nitrosomonadaceae bacterium]|nr:hypothetical protein [Nitrosomonadaceae bacterium]
MPLSTPETLPAAPVVLPSNHLVDEGSVYTVADILDCDWSLGTDGARVCTSQGFEERVDFVL